MPDNTLSTLAQIRIKVRRLTRSPSPNQLSDDDIDKYINTFVLYDFPENVRLKALRGNFTFYVDPNIDTYENNTTDPTSPLYNFINEYITFHSPVFVAGYEAYFSQSQEEFYRMYPKLTGSYNVGTGDGITVNFTGTLSQIPVLRNSVVFSSVDVNEAGLEAHDDGAGNLVQDGADIGTINYLTGAYDITWATAAKSGTSIYAQTFSYVASRPTVILYYNNKFTVRPVPDTPYKVEMEAFRRPTELLNGTDQPELAQWWQYISYGAAKKVFEDRMDMESVNLLMPEFNNQERLVLRRTLIQQGNQRVATIYSSQTEGGTDSGDVLKSI